ncbi:L-arabinokinase [Tetrabaena socialis]|uniref:L-arabinokinase n=1 Tax=Tetrabaena socialis TaxID=47790 RepID=A0A2J7ZLT9_9CHLO|nr:L-arabinokinase [Tetrabaena socialis]|eukprot:PNH01231.1 L-arabinokinase [Tetrabaena socialis]
MGGIADYSGSLVLQMPIGEAAHVALQIQAVSPGAQAEVRIVSIPAPGEEAHRTPSFSCPIADLFPGGQPLPYEAARAFFQGAALAEPG